MKKKSFPLVIITAGEGGTTLITPATLTKVTIDKACSPMPAALRTDSKICHIGLSVIRPIRTCKRATHTHTQSGFPYMTGEGFTSHANLARFVRVW